MATSSSSVRSLPVSMSISRSYAAEPRTNHVPNGAAYSSILLTTMNIVVLGAQWGDEGKGKIVDLLTPHFSIVARYQGGHNAGHTVYVGGRSSCCT